MVFVTASHWHVLVIKTINMYTRTTLVEIVQAHDKHPSMVSSTASVPFFTKCLRHLGVCGNSVKLVLMLVLCFLWLIDGLHDASSMWLHDPASPTAFALTQHSSHLFSSLKYTRCPLYVLSNSSVLALRVFSSSRCAPSSLFNPMYHWHNWLTAYKSK